MKRVWIIGHPGSGKTTLSNYISNINSLPILELDGVLWEPNWTKCSPDHFCDCIRRFLHDNHSWIIDGMYENGAELILEKVDTVIYLNEPLHILIARVLKRSAIRISQDIELWNKNKESISRLLWDDSFIYYIISTYSSKIKEANYYLEYARNNGKRTFTLRNRDYKELLSQLETQSE